MILFVYIISLRRLNRSTMTAEKLEYLAHMNELYGFAEGQFLEFNVLVPISKNDDSVVSPKLYYILMTMWSN